MSTDVDRFREGGHPFDKEFVEIGWRSLSNETVRTVDDPVAEEAAAMFEQVLVEGGRSESEARGIVTMARVRVAIELGNVMRGRIE